MKWARIDVGIGEDPTVIAMAVQLGVPVPQAVGHVTLCVTRFVTHARNGNIANVHDSALELWAQWNGNAGEFARVFRAMMCDDNGVVRSWKKHNGAAIRKADKDLRRVQQWREQQRKERERNAKRNADVTRNKAGDGTGRDGSSNISSTIGFEAVWAAYPKRAGGDPRKAALKAYNARLAAGVDPAAILAGVERYAAFIRATGKEGTQFVQRAATFLGPDEHWAEAWALPQPKSVGASTAGRRELTQYEHDLAELEQQNEHRIRDGRPLMTLHDLYPSRYGPEAA